MDHKRNTLVFSTILRDITPPIWRRIEVPASYSFWDLHVAIQDAMPWLDYHLHLFTVRDPLTGADVHVGIPDEDGFDDFVTLAGWTVPITDQFHAPRDQALYEYDFGDGWMLDVVLESVGMRHAGTKYPRCVDGARKAPPEDCGGVSGYESMLRILDDPADDEYKSMIEWLGGPFDPDAFDPTQVRFDNPKTRWRHAFTDDS